ncbi:MAG: dephospho-CoA kinase [Actinomycetota bacterium]|nr:dephospho-CoA kinase [Actinomycetota bacterium]
MLRVGLTGGIGSGKSAVSALLADHGAIVIDYDQLAREVVEPGAPALAEIARRFGDGILTADGALNRPALGAIVFNDPESLRTLEAITHPAIRALARECEASAGPDAIVVHDNALLVEMGHHNACDVVIVVDVPQETQIERLVATRGMTEAEARARITNQTSRESRTGVADFIIDNTGSLDGLALIVGGLWTKLVGLSG